MFDTYKAVNQLKEAGFSEIQAVAIVQVVRDALTAVPATKIDIVEVRAAIASLKTDMLEMTESLRTDMVSRTDMIMRTNRTTSRAG